MDEADAGTSSGRLPLRTLPSYGASMIGLNGMLAMVGIHLLFFCTEVARIGPRAVSLAMALRRQEERQSSAPPQLLRAPGPMRPQELLRRLRCSDGRFLNSQKRNPFRKLCLRRNVRAGTATGWVWHAHCSGP
jgi:hypothetical protein